MTRFNFILISVICVVMFDGPSFAQDNATDGGTLRGTITDTTEARNPIKGVTVKIVAQDGTDYKIKTDANGDYKYTGLPAGRYLINIYKAGYLKRVGKPVTIVNGGDHLVRLKMGKKSGASAEVDETFLQHISESIGKRYNLDTQVVDALHQSISKAVETAQEDASEFGRSGEESGMALIEELLSHPDCKAAFAEHLTETELQDYLNVNKARRQRDQLAAAQIMTAVLDEVLSLTPDQRQNVTPLLFDGMRNAQLTATNILWGVGPHLQLHYTVVEALHLELNVSLDEILTPTQAKVWQGMIKRAKIKREDGEIGVEVLKPKADSEILSKEKEVDDEYDVTTSQLWQLTEAILTAHTELLGPLHEHASHRLALVTKGIVQQHFETQYGLPSDNFETILRFAKTLSELMEAYQADKITREEALGKLNTIREELWDQRDANIRSGEAEVYDITDHPLYQQTLKDVLSEEAFIQYNEHQIQRKTFCQQALRDLIVVLVDIQLLLDDTQRKHFEEIAAQLTVPPLTEAGFVIMLLELVFSADREILSPWQRRVMEKQQ